ncbi:hypothetical protein D3C87_1292560 [compost metagenome]
MSGKVHQISAVFAVVDREIHVQSNLFRIDSQEARADPVKRAGPGHRIGEGSGVSADDLLADTLDTTRHFGGGTP